MPPPRIAKAPLQHERKPRDGMSKDHLVMIRQLPCLGCDPLMWTLADTFVVQAHHIMRSGERGLSLKSPDKFAVPLCWAHHGPSPYDNVTDTGDEDAWFSKRGIDARAVAAALWSARGDLEAMRRIVFRARQQARLVSP